MTLKDNLEAAAAAIAAVPAEYRRFITLEQAFVAEHTFKFVLIVLAAGVVLGVLLVGALVLVIGHGWGLWLFGLWVFALLIVAFTITAAFRPRLAIKQ